MTTAADPPVFPPAVRLTRPEAPTPAVPTPEASARGPRSGELVFTYVAGRTVLAKALSRSPLKLLAPRNHGRAAWVFAASYGGGLVGGDHLHIDLNVGAGAAALLGTQASTKVYRSPLGSSQRLHAKVGPDGLLVVLPDPVVCFAGSNYTQEVEVDVAPGASLVLVDALSCGRSARGERWAFDRYAARTHVARAGRPVLLDALLLDPAHGALLDRMGRFDALATVVLLGPRVQYPGGPRDAMLARSSRISHAPPARRAELITSASPLGDDGIIVRIAGASVEHVTRAVRSALEFLAGELGDDPFVRKW